MSGPSPRQLEALRFMARWHMLTRSWPGLRRVATHLNHRSHKSTEALLRRLERKGLVMRDPVGRFTLTLRGDEVVGAHEDVGAPDRGRLSGAG